MTKQSIFNQVWKHFVTNNQPLSYSNGQCKYRGDQGAKCAVGLLIPDDIYYPALEGATVTSSKMFPVLRLLGLSDHIVFLNELQDAHDDVALDYGDADEPGRTATLKNSLMDIALAQGLSCPD